ncbi:hypothetical protein ARMGADRAFT_797986 [Armillaria gallica]|uniref:F-box domain-containing protein n=1 Tax=Armillaria gallica TaxID=47427 RepID=A0A2H3DND3_ARMGA|nr:hypothetical protein ARMGADRAFT_797986 [Armillaria gallica]
MAYQSRLSSATMYLQELIDEILDYLHDSPSALKACSLVSRQFYPRTRIHLFREINCRSPESARVFDIARDSPDLLHCIKRVQFRVLDFFLPKHLTATVDLLHSLSFSVTLSICDNRDSNEICKWQHVLPAFVSSTPYLAITRLELISPWRWCISPTFLEYHHIVLSLPNVTELHISGLTELSTNEDPVVPAPPAPRIRKMYVEVQERAGTVLSFWEDLRLYRSMYLEHLEEFRVGNLAPVELWAVVQTAHLASNDLKVLEIECYQGPFAFARLSPNITPLHLNPPTYLRLGVFLNNDELPFINWWIKCFEAVENESTVMERLTIKLTGWRSPITMEQVKLLTRAFEELSNLLPKLVRNVDLVFQLWKTPNLPNVGNYYCKRKIIDACYVLKEKTNLRVFDMMEHTYSVPVFPFPASTKRMH